jgi:rubrerythrin
MNRKKKGIRVARGESALAAIQKAVPHWIHEKIEDPSSVTGFMYSRSCTCSECGYEASFEKPKCPHCGADMQYIKGLQ